MKKMIELFYDVKNHLVQDINNLKDPTGADKEKFEILNKRLKDVNKAIEDEKNLWFERYDYPEGSFEYYLQSFKYHVKNPEDTEKVYYNLLLQLNERKNDPSEIERRTANIVKAKNAFNEPIMLKDLLKKQPGMPVLHGVQLKPDQLNAKVKHYTVDKKEGNSYILKVETGDTKFSIPMMFTSFIPQSVKNSLIEKAASKDDHIKQRERDYERER